MKPTLDKLRLNPMQGAIIDTLREAGAETLFTLIATVRPTDLVRFERDLVAMIRAGLVQPYRVEPNDPYYPLDDAAFQSLLPLAERIRIDQQAMSISWQPGAETPPETFEGFMLPDNTE